MKCVANERNFTVGIKTMMINYIYCRYLTNMSYLAPVDYRLEYKMLAHMF